MSFVEWFIAFRYIRSKRSEGFVTVSAWFSLIGIALGVATLIIVMSVMNGFRSDLINRIIGVNGHLQVYNKNTNVINDIIKNPNVIQATPTIEEQVMITNKGNGSGIIFRGVSKEDLSRQKLIHDGIVYGSLDKFADKSIVIGRKLANILHVKVGDSVLVISPNGYDTAFGGLPRFASFKVVALFNVGMYEFDTGLAYVPIDFAKKFLLRDSVDRIDIFIKNPRQVNSVADELFSSVPNLGYLLTWEQTNKSIVGALDVERNVMFLILTLIIVIASFNVISGMIMLVKIKNKDIAILRTIGARGIVVMRIFFIIGSSIGVIGTFFGTILGLLFCAYIDNIRKILEFLLNTRLFPEEIYYLSRMPSEVRSTQVIAVILIALIISVLAAIYPSYKASRVYPAKALKED